MKKTLHYENISQEYINKVLTNLVQDNKIIHKLNQNNLSYHLNENVLNKSLIDLLPESIPTFN